MPVTAAGMLTKLGGLFIVASLPAFVIDRSIGGVVFLLGIGCLTVNPIERRPCEEVHD